MLSWIKERVQRNKLISGVLLLSLFLRLFLFSRHMPVGWDSSVYIGMGKYLFSGGSAGLWEMIRPPLIPIILGFSWKVGLDPVVFGRFMAISFSLGSIFMVYLIGKDVFGKKTGLVASLVFGLIPFFVYYSLRIMTGIPATFFSLVSVYFFLKGGRRGLLLSGVFAGIAFLTRFPTGLIFPVLLSVLLYKERKNLSIKGLAERFCPFFCSFVLSVLPYFLFNLARYGSMTQPLETSSIVAWRNAWAYGSGLFFYFRELFVQMPLFVFAVPGIYFVAKNYDHRKGLIVLVSLGFLSYFTYFPNKQVRFALVLIPYLSLLAAHGLVESLKRFRGKVNIKLITGLLILGLVISGFFLAGSLKGKRYSSFLSGKEPRIYEFYKELRKIDGKGEKILTNRPVVSSFTDAKVEVLYRGMIPPGEGGSYEELIGGSDYVVMYTCLPRCPNQTEKCLDRREDFMEGVKRDNIPLKKLDFGSCDYLILRVPKTRKK